MNPLIEFLQRTVGTMFINEDGIKEEFRLLPPLSKQELTARASLLPCDIPPEILELCGFASGFSGTWLQDINFAGNPAGFGLECIFPHAIELAHDGLGNSWIVDLTIESHSWAPIFYACHDAPVIVYQTDSLLHFIEEVIRDGNKPWKSEISDVWGPFSDRIWAENPGVLSCGECVASDDPDLHSFAASLDESWLFVDLRNPKIGDGFSWGRYGPKTVVQRCGNKRIFAYQKKSFGRRLLDTLR